MAKGEYTQIRYHLEVEHEPGTFDDDMDSLTQDPKDAYQMLQSLKAKYKDHKIKITKITETKTYQPLPEGDLEKLTHQV